MQLLTQNSKMKKASKKTFNFGITAHYSKKYSMFTCPSALTCVANCYARQGTYNFTSVKNAYENRLGITLQNDFPELMIKEIKAKKAEIIRIHDSGDFYSREYLQKWLKIIDNFPNVVFYAYTKSYKMVLSEKLPKNFIVIQSEGSKEEIDYTKRHAVVFNSLTSLKNAGYNNASVDDTQAWSSDSIKIGLVYHGNKKATGNFVRG